MQARRHVGSVGVRWDTLAAIVVAPVIAFGMSGMTQERPDHRIESLETRVAALEAEVFGLPVMGATPGVTSAAAVSTPEMGGSGGIVVDSASTRFPVAGNAFHLLEVGTPGELSVVAQGAIVGAEEIPIILRNNTADPLANVGVGAEARDANGGLIASASTYLGDFIPVLDPGAVTFANITFDEPLPQGTTVTLFPEGYSDSSRVEHYATTFGGVELTEFTASPEQILGSVRNIGEAPIEVSSATITVACFDASQSFSGVLDVSPARDILGPGETTAFEQPSYITPPPCDYFLVTGYGDRRL